MPVFRATRPLHLDLTVAFLTAQGMTPIFAGADWRLRFQLRDEHDAPVDLTGWDIAMHVKAAPTDEGPLFVRRLDEPISEDDDRPQIEVDADQTAENAATATGRGWFTVRGSDDDEDALLAAAGLRFYDVRVQSPTADADAAIAFRGRIEISVPVTRADAFT